jgi:molybdenum cofactor cytidylyltransferase
MNGRAAAVVPAAGRSERFGGMKLVAAIGGEPLLDHTLRSLIDGGLAPIVVVRSPDSSLDAVARLGHHAVVTVVNPDPGRGMFSSIQTGLAAAPAAPTLVLPADMPFVAAGTTALVARTVARADKVVVPVFRGHRGHPVGLPARLREALLMFDPSQSLKQALTALEEEWLEVEVDDEGVVRDVDRKGDLNRGSEI